MRVRALLAAAAAALALAAPAAAQVPDPYARQLAQRLASIDRALAEERYLRAAGPFSGGLEQGGAVRFTVTLRAGQDYRIVGVCDARCIDLDLRLSDGAEAVLDEDVRDERSAMLSVRPLATGPHGIDAIMARCADPPCYFAFNVYAR